MMGKQMDPDDEARRQFRIGFAAGVLGLVKFHEVLLTVPKGAKQT